MYCYGVIPCYSKTQHVLYLYAAKHTVNQHYFLCVLFQLYKGILL